MSVTRQEPGPVRMVRASEPDGVLGDPSHYDGENPPACGFRKRCSEPTPLIRRLRIVDILARLVR